jgi:3-carboxy-cis,cis-muconate cycloisomerase
VRSHVIDSAIYRDQFGTPEMRAVFSDEHLAQYWLDVEAALARAEARLGIIPDEAARSITEAARVEFLDLDEIREQVDLTGHPLVPIIRSLARACPGDSGQFVHWGATTQDIMDTAMVLQLREALGILGRQLDALVEVLAGLARRYRDTPMAGRTHGQHALPITFGFKLAVLIAEFHRHRLRMRELQPRLTVGQLSGAVGTLASLGPSAADAQREFMQELELAVPVISWHTARDNLAEFVNLMGLIGATCAKAAGEVILLQKTEVGEVEEPHTESSVGSSTMPQKRNPMRCEAVVALGRILRQHGALAMDCMVQQHERDMSAWQAEWEFIPEAAILASGALDQTRKVFAGLTVRPDRMAVNLAITGGLINAEAVMMSLAPGLGRQRAHELVGTAARESFESGRPFLACLMALPDIAELFGEGELKTLLEPEAYLGGAIEAVDRVLAWIEE